MITTAPLFSHAEKSLVPDERVNRSHRIAAEVAHRRDVQKITIVKGRTNDREPTVEETTSRIRGIRGGDGQHIKGSPMRQHGGWL
jgi:hypothetical protein